MVIIWLLVCPFKKLAKIKMFTTSKQMGTDIHVQLLYGYKITLLQAFDAGLLRPEIMEDDDWQLIGDVECRDEIITRHVLSPQLRELLENGEWNLHILASTQIDCDPATSFLFIHNKRDVLYSGRVPDYECGVVNSAQTINGAHSSVLDIHIPGLNVEYAVHWVVEGSW
jgi:hypothetical protein